LAEQIFLDLRLHIIRGQLPPGSRLPSERALAEGYGANRNTVREAIRKLEQGRLVTVRHGQGVTVLDFRRTGTIDLLQPFLEGCPDEVERTRVLLDLLAARNEVVSYAVDMAVRRAAPEHRLRLEAIAELLRADFQRGDALSVAQGTQDWLEALIDAAGSLPVRWLANAFLELHQGLIQRFPSLCVLEPGLPDYLEAFLAAMDRGQSSECRELTRRYFQRVDLILLARIHQSTTPLGPASTQATPPWAQEE